jgi:phosphoglycerate kinase
MRTLSQINITGKRVLLRSDLNVPLKDNGEIADDFKIKKSLKTIKYILKHAKQVIILTHLGRPEGKKDPKYKVDNIALRLMKYLGRTVAKLDDCVDIIIPEEKIVLLENVRFHKEEMDNDPGFAKKLASHADIYVNDAFGVSQRKHASLVGVAKILPSCAGLLVEDEIKHLDFKLVEKPFVVIMGGSKLSTKFPVINSLIPKVDKLLLGGAMIFTFYKADNLQIGNSLYEEDQIVTARLLLHNEKIVLPKDILVGKDTNDNSPTIVYTNGISKNKIGLDIGPETVELFKKELKKAKTIFWNGPLGYYESETYAQATYEIAKFLANSNARVIIGGGDSVTVIDKLGLREQFAHISTGGGASLEYIQSGTLVALEVLKS